MQPIQTEARQADSSADTQSRGMGSGKNRHLRYHATRSVLHLVEPALVVAERVAHMPARHDLYPLPNERPRFLLKDALISNRYTRLLGLGLKRIGSMILQVDDDEGVVRIQRAHLQCGTLEEVRRPRPPAFIESRVCLVDKRVQRSF